MIASLGMYDFPDGRAANDRLWAGVRDRLRAAGIPAPEALTRGPDALWPAWESPGLVLSQTCGLPYRARLRGRVTLVASPDYGLEGCPPGYYRSLLVARAEDPRGRVEEFDGARLVFSEDLSQSGWAAPQHHARRLGIALRPVLRSGSHAGSVRALSGGRADIAGIDAHSWRLIGRNDPAAVARLRVIGATDPTPATPFVTARGRDAAAVFAALHAAVGALSPADRAATGLRGIVRLPEAAYLAVPEPGPPALPAQDG